VIIGVALTVLTVGISDVAAGAVAGSLIAAAAVVGIELSTEVAAIIATGLVFTGMGALEGGLSDLAIQGERMGYFHDQAAINWNEVLQYTAVGGATAGVTFGAGAAIEAGAPALGRIANRLTGSQLEMTAGDEAAVGGYSIRDVNPGFPTQGRVSNCANCAVATDATLAGRPAVALPGGPTRVSVLEKYFGGLFQPMRSPADIERGLQAAGPGARGIVFGQRAGGIGHFFNGVNQGGVVRFLDGQLGDEASFRGFSAVWWLWTSRP
jgi:filamentous hemagglutinin